MHRWEFLLLVTLVAAATPALGQGTQGAASIPDFSGLWWHPSLPGFEPPASGPGPVTNRSRRNGVSNYDQLVGDYSNPILKPATAEIVNPTSPTEGLGDAKVLKSLGRGPKGRHYRR